MQITESTVALVTGGASGLGEQTARRLLAEGAQVVLVDLPGGRGEEVAAALFVHPQPVRYRVGQLREHYGDRLDDPDFVEAATVALAGEALSDARR